MNDPAPPDPQRSPWDGPTAAPAATPAPEGPAASRTGWKQWAAAGVVAAVVAVGAGVGISLAGGDDSSSVAARGPAAAAASGYGGDLTGRPGFPGAMGTAGTITAIDGSTITVEAAAAPGGTSTETSTVKVATTDETTVTESVSGSVDDLAEGDHVTVMGTTADGAVTAQRIVDSRDVESSFGGGGGGQMGTPPSLPDGAEQGSLPDAPTGTPPSGGFPGGAPTAGTIASIDGDTVVVETSDGTKVTVTVTDDTEVSITEQISVGDLAEGDTVMVAGTTSGSTVAAETIRKGELGGGGAFGGGPGMTPPAGGTPPGGTDSGTGSGTGSDTAPSTTTT